MYVWLAALILVITSMYVSLLTIYNDEYASI